ncbi:MAG: MMPL family transporter [Nitrospirae bacterium]|nr:MMPL family transporter [Nitrospirota bacterium]
MTARYLAFVLRHRVAALAFAILGTIFFGYELSRVRIHTNFFELYPPRHPFIKVYREFRKLFGTANLLLVVMENKEGHVVDPPFMRKLDEATRFLMDTKGVNPFQVISLTHPSVRGFRVRGFSVASAPIVESLPKDEKDSNEIRLNIERNQGVKGFIVSEDGRSTLLVVGLWEEELDFHYLGDRLQEFQSKFTSPSTEIHITGFPALYSWIHHYMPRIHMVFAITAAALLLMLFFFFGDGKGVVIPFVAALVSAEWGLGMAGLVGLAIDPLLLVVPLLLSARALSHSVQIMERYYTDFGKYPNKVAAVQGSFKPLMRPALLSIITDGLGILTIAVSGIPLMWKLAVYSSFWIGSILIGVLTVSPVLLSLFPPPGSKPYFSSRKFYDLLARIEIRILAGERRIKAMFVLFIVLIVGGGIVGTRLRVGNLMPGAAILPADHPYNVATEHVNKNFAGSNRFVVIVEGDQAGAVKKIENLRTIDRFAERLKEATNASGSITLTQVVSRVYMFFREGDPNWEILPYRESDVGAIAFPLSQGRELQSLFSTDFKDATVTLFYTDFSAGIIEKIVAEAQRLAKEMSTAEIKFRLAGGLLGVLAAVNEEVERSYWLILGVVLSTTFLLVLFFYRSLRAAFILVPPLLLSQFLSEAFMYLGGIDMNINSLPVAAVGIGVGIDYGIYVYERLQEELGKGAHFLDAYRTTIQTTGKAVLFTATTLVAGVIFWVFTPLKFTSEMALLLALLMILNYIGALIFVPVLAKMILPGRSQTK